MNNTEILVKEALMGAEEAGAEVELIRLHDLKNISLKPNPLQHELPARLEKYKKYLTYSKPAH